MATTLAAHHHDALRESLRAALLEQGVIVSDTDAQSIIEALTPTIRDIAMSASVTEPVTADEPDDHFNELPGFSALDRDMQDGIRQVFGFMAALDAEAGTSDGPRGWGFADVVAAGSSGASFGAEPHATYERPADLAGGPGTTEPFAIILTDPSDWPYNNAYVSTDAAALHRIEHDKTLPRDEILWAVVDPEDGEPTYAIEQAGSYADSEAQWWAGVNADLAKAGIGPKRTFEGIYY